jgi:hypothetical protein
MLAPPMPAVPQIPRLGTITTCNSVHHRTFAAECPEGLPPLSAALSLGATVQLAQHAEDMSRTSTTAANNRCYHKVLWQSSITTSEEYAQEPRCAGRTCLVPGGSATTVGRTVTKCDSLLRARLWLSSARNWGTGSQAITLHSSSITISGAVQWVKGHARL